MLSTYVDVQTTEVLAEFLLFLWTNILEVLVTEHHNTALGYQQSKLILLRVSQLRQLQASDLGADTGCQLCDLQVVISL